MEHVNVAVVVGEIVTEPVERSLASGETVINCDLASVTEAGRAIVPIVLTDTDTQFALGDSVCVVGFMRKRFFQTSAGLQNRTELAVHKSARVRQKAQVKKIVDSAVQDIRGAARG